MTPKQYAELLEYITKNNGWGIDMYVNRCERHRRVFKYIDASFDSRDGHIWRIDFREGSGHANKSFRIENEADIKAVYAYLDEEVTTQFV